MCKDKETTSQDSPHIKPKGFLWKLTFPFAHANYTVVGNTIYYPKGNPPSHKVMAHELVHMKQIKENGLKFYFLYLLALPILWNPWRYKWEMEAYVEGSGISKQQAHKKLNSSMYGWLKNYKD